MYAIVNQLDRAIGNVGSLCSRREWLCYMEKEKWVLPMSKPMITGYPPIANLFAILECHDFAYPWLFSNYIQIYAYRFKRQIEVLAPEGFEAMRLCPWINCGLIDRTLFFSLNDGVLDFLIKSIAAGNYIYCVGDVSCFSQTDGSAKPHDMFIYGYDKNERVFYVSDFVFRLKYSFEKLPFEEVEQAILSIDKTSDYLFTGRGGIALLNVFTDTYYDLDTKLIRQSLVELKESTNSSANCRILNNPATYAVFGLDVYDYLITYLHDLAADLVNSNIKPLHNLYDHKVLMLKRLEFMNKSGCLREYEIHRQAYESIKNAFSAMSNMMVKYIFCGEDDILLRIEKWLLLMKQTEKEALERLIESVVDIPIQDRPCWSERTNLDFKGLYK